MPLNRIVTDSIADSSVASRDLAQNLAISLSRTLEEANINLIAPGGNVNIDVSNNTVYFFGANTTANVTFNIRANATNTFDSATAIGETTSVAIAVKHGTSRHSANLYIDGGLITNGATPFAGSWSANSILYAGNTRPAFASITNAEINLFNFTVFKTAANQYTVFAGNTIFGLGG